MAIINYDIDIDLRIIHSILLSKDQVSSVSNLRYNAVGTPAKLEEHISNLVRWEMITDNKPEKFGCARKITLKNKPYEECIAELTELKNAIKMVNQYLD